MRTAVLITTGQPSVNPRIVKEADALVEAGFSVTVLYSYWINWAEEADTKLLRNVKWQHRLIGGSPYNNKWRYYFTRIRFKVFQVLTKKGINKHLIAERAQARCYDELLEAAKSIRANIYIGHNLGAMAVAVNAAHYHNAKAGFDFEDYHREENDNESSFVKNTIVFIEKKYVSNLSYISASSSLIADRVKNNFPLFHQPILTILNCFPVQPICKKSTRSTILSLFWFSQTIGKNRGLETVIIALNELNLADIHLTLAGRADPGFLNFIGQFASCVKDRIHFAGVVPPDSLPDFAASFDVGLATELTTPINRDICLTNKLFTYLVAGNCILASDTSAQKQFMKEHGDIGFLYKHEDVNDCKEKLLHLYNYRTSVEVCKTNSRSLAISELNWANEAKKLTTLIASIFHNVDVAREFESNAKTLSEI